VAEVVSAKNEDEHFVVSVCLCTYNGVSFLRPQLDSIFSQTRQPDEVVICDDHSKDGTLAILEEYAAKYTKQIKLFANRTNLGYRLNFPKAFGLCHGDIVFFADQDDVWQNDKIEKILSVYVQHPDLAMVASNAELIDEDGKRMGAFIPASRIKRFNRSQEQWRSLLRAPMIPGTSMSVKKAAFEAYQPFPKDFVHDEWLSLAASFLNRGYILNDKTTLYRQHKGQAIGGSQSLSSQVSEQLDYALISEKYKALSYSMAYPISDKIRAELKKKSDFLLFRAFLRDTPPFKSLFVLLGHPSDFMAYHRFCLHPFLSRIKDVFTRKNK
jgi:glycosyltransferase involved in cell wall biosynthesis